MNTTNKTIEYYFLTNMAMCPSHVLMLINCNINILSYSLFILLSIDSAVRSVTILKK